jgi:hypothetical protein
MTTGNSWAALVLCLAAQGAFAAEWGLAELMKSLREVKQVKARFVEKKQLAILDKPLESSGTLEYAAGGRLEKRVLKPRQESLVLENDRLTLERGGQRRTMALRDNAVVGTLVESIRATLAGDQATLQKLFRTTLEGQPSKWRLQLVPIESRMLGFVTEVRIAGRGTWVDTVEFVEPQGDHSVMTILKDGP